MPTFLRSLLVLILSIALLAPLGAVHAAPGKPTGFSCSNNSVNVTPLHSPIFYEDSKSGLTSQWVGYRIESTNVEVEISSLNSSRLETGNAGLIPKIDESGAYSTVYSLLTDSGPKGGSLGHQITILKNQAVIQTCTYYFAAVVDSRSADSSVVNSVSPANLSYQTTAPIIYSGEQGNLISVSLDGNAGMLEKGSILTFAPTPKITWDSSIDLQLVGIKWRLGSDTQLYKDQLWVNVQDNLSSSYHVEYTFRVSVGNKTDFQISPVIYVQDSISADHSNLGVPAIFSIIDRPNSNFFAALNHAFTGSLSVAGGKPPYTWKIAQGDLPAGLTLSPTGQISGTPTEATSKSLVLDVNSSISPKVTSFPITITVQDAVVTSDVSDTGYLNNKFGPYKLDTAGIKKVNKWSLKGRLPKGLTFKDGEVRGTPEEVGDFEFTITAEGDSDEPTGKDSKGNPLPSRNTKAERQFKVSVKEKKPPKPPKVSENLVDLQLGSSANGDGYVEVFGNNQCPGSDGNLTHINPSSNANPYTGDLNNGYCVISEISMNSPAAKQTLSASNVKLNFSFFNGNDGTTPVSVIMSGAIIKSASTESNIKVSKNSNCSSNNSETQASFCIGDLSLTNNSSNSMQVTPILVLAKGIKVLDRTVKILKVVVRIDSDSLEMDAFTQVPSTNEVGANNGCGNGQQSSPGNSGKNNNGSNNSKCSDSSGKNNGSPDTVTQSFVSAPDTNNVATFWISDSTNPQLFYPYIELGSSAFTASAADLDPKESYFAVFCYTSQPDVQISYDSEDQNVNCYAATNSNSSLIFTNLRTINLKLADTVTKALDKCTSYFYKAYLFAASGSDELTTDNPFVYSNQELLSETDISDGTSVDSSCSTDPNIVTPTKPKSSGGFYYGGQDNGDYEEFLGGNGDIYLGDASDDSFYEDDINFEVPLPAPTPNQRLYNLPKYNLINGCRKGGICTSAQIADAEKSFKTVLGNQGRFPTASGLIMLPPGIPKGWFFAIPESSEPLVNGKAFLSPNSKGNGLIVTSDSGWTGFLHLPLLAVSSNAKSLMANGASSSNVVTSVAGILFTLDIQIYPNAPATGKYQNSADGKTTITWEKSTTSTVTKYDVYASGKKICSTKLTTCQVKALLGPKTIITVVATGNSQTRSSSRKLSYLAGKNILVLTVHFDSGKSKIKNTDIASLKKLSEFVKREGYSSIYVVGHTDPVQRSINLALSKARAQSVISYLVKGLPGVAFSGTALADKVLISSGKSKAALALDRRVEIFVK